MIHGFSEPISEIPYLVKQTVGLQWEQTRMPGPEQANVKNTHCWQKQNLCLILLGAACVIMCLIFQDRLSIPQDQLPSGSPSQQHVEAKVR